MTRIGTWWQSVSRFFWPAAGMLWAVYGVYRLVHVESIGLGIMAIGSGTTVAIVSLTTMKCSNCGSSGLVERIHASLNIRHQFTCRNCGAQYKLPGWNGLLFQIISLGGAIIFLIFMYRYLPDLTKVLTFFLDGTFICNAILFLLVRLSHYQKLDRGKEQPASKVLS